MIRVALIIPRIEPQMLHRPNGGYRFFIPVSDFNHGGARQKMVVANPDYDVYVLM